VFVTVEQRSKVGRSIQQRRSGTPLTARDEITRAAKSWSAGET
jgi:hypothetical protein